MENQITLTLSPEELELIETKRKEEEAKKEREVQKELEYVQKLIQNEKLEIDKKLKSQAKCFEFVETVEKEIIEAGFEKKIESYVDYSHKVVRNEKVIFEQPVECKKIWFQKGNYKINIAEHFVDVSTGMFRYRTESRGVKLFVSGPEFDSYVYDRKAFVRPKTVIDKINAAIAKSEYKKSNIELLEESANKVYKKLKLQFPNAEVKLELDWDYGWRNGKRIYDEPERIAFVKIKFENSMKVSYRVLRDGGVVISITSYPIKMSEVVDLLKDIPKTT